jgi:NTP pyrophosphatase (non-canonical NTP hydrolase)
MTRREKELADALRIAMRSVESDATLTMCRKALAGDGFYPEGKDYREEMLRTCNPDFLANFRRMVSNAGLGLAGEAGECADLAKKFLHHEDRPNQTREVFDKSYRAKMIKELGDLRWYTELMIHAIGSTIEEVEYGNALKLRARYPEGFSAEAAKARVDLAAPAEKPKAAESAYTQFEKKESER